MPSQLLGFVFVNIITLAMTAASVKRAYTWVCISSYERPWLAFVYGLQAYTLGGLVFFSSQDLVYKALFGGLAYTGLTVAICIQVSHIGNKPFTNSRVNYYFDGFEVLAHHVAMFAIVAGSAYFVFG